MTDIQEKLAETALAVPDELIHNPVTIFAIKGNVEILLSAIEQQAASIVPDPYSNKGRKEIASLAHRIARTKTLLDDYGKNLNAEWREKMELVNVGRRQIRERLDQLKAQVREPLTTWEMEQAAIAEAKKLQEEIEAAHEEALQMDELFELRREKEEREAAERKRQEEIARKKREEEEKRQREIRENALKQQAAAEAREAEKKRQEEIQAEAKRKAQEAIDKLKREKEEAARKLIEEQQAEERRKKEAAREEERRRKQAEAREAERKLQEERRIKEAEEKARREEREKQEQAMKAHQEMLAKKAKQARRKAHVTKIDREAAADIVKQLMESFDSVEETASCMVEAIKEGRIRHITLNY